MPCSHLIRDYQGNFWVGTLGQGLKVIPDLASQFVGVAQDYIFTSLLYRDDLFIGTRRGKVFKNNQLLVETNVPIHLIYAIEDKVLVQSAKDIYLIDGDQIIQRPFGVYYNHAFTRGQTTIVASKYRVYRVDALLQKIVENQLAYQSHYDLGISNRTQFLCGGEDDTYYGLNLGSDQLEGLHGGEVPFGFGDQQIRQLLYSTDSGSTEVLALGRQAEIVGFNFVEGRIDSLYRFRSIRPVACTFNSHWIVGYEKGVLEIFDRTEGQTYVYDKLAFSAAQTLVSVHVDESEVYVVYASGYHRVRARSGIPAISKYISHPLTLGTHGVGQEVSFAQDESIRVVLILID
ncbi:MAG: hypothetical protein AAF146_18950 [Bacteroidota bacterium]